MRSLLRFLLVSLICSLLRTEVALVWSVIVSSVPLDQHHAVCVFQQPHRSCFSVTHDTANAQ